MSEIAWQTIGPYRGIVHASARTAACEAVLADLARRVQAAEVLQAGRHRTVRLTLGATTGALDVAVKCFGRQSALKDRYDYRRGSKAYRTYAAADYLCSRGIGTAAPVACLERWQDRRLVASYYVARYLPDMVSLKGELVRLFAEDPECARFMELLETVACAIRRMHDNDFMHRDLGNQNILLASAAAAGVRPVFFLDLNRGRIRAHLSDGDRGRDLSRIALPSDFRRVFLEMYWQAPPPPAFLRRERASRRAFAWHTATRRWRHPLRERKRSLAPVAEGDYPHPRDQWVWDSRSEQPVPTLRPRDRHRHYPLSHLPQLAAGVLPALPAVWHAYRQFSHAAFQTPVMFDRAFAVALTARHDTLRREIDLLAELGIRDVLVRFHHHEKPPQRRMTLAGVHELAERGLRVSGALVQDRRAVRESQAWGDFCHGVLSHVGWHLEWLEFAHAINRVKWGVWGIEDYRRLLTPLPSLRHAYPGVKFVGPAVIDFEFEHALAALREVPPGCTWDAFSAHLYVDRRGAPENLQGRFDALAKFALARAIARTSERCLDRVIVSEVNWPLQGTGVYSPVGAPYVSPGLRQNDPSVSEEDYANYLVRYLLLAACSGLVHQTVVWRLAAHGFGLVDDRAPDGWRKRPAFAALGVLQRTLSGGRFVRRIDLPQHDPRQVYLLACTTADGAPVLVGWANGLVAEVDAPFRLHRAHDAQGRAFSLPSDARLRLGPSPTYAFGADATTTR